MKKGGFSFLELLIALSLFAVGMVSVLQIFPLNRRFLAQSAATTQASFLAQEGIEMVRATDYAELTPGIFQAKEKVSTDTEDPLSRFERQITVALIDSNHQATSTDVGLKRVEVVVYWSERGVDRHYNVVTYVSNR